MCFIGYATIPNRLSMSLCNVSTGSWYLQELCKAFRENKHDLVTMVTLVHGAEATKPQYCHKSIQTTTTDDIWVTSVCEVSLLVLQ